MTRRASMLDAIEPVPVISMHPQELEKIGVKPGDRIKVTSRRGELVGYARADTWLQSGQIFIPFNFREAAANLLTNPALDPFGKIPEFKFCAVQVVPADPDGCLKNRPRPHYAKALAPQLSRSPTSASISR